ncbi:hypothetical protein GF312_05240 [Candidatus Poribacteria bacterium]|nr:hypothetical protein [Candidatus Poribacteria bacterium]
MTKISMRVIIYLLIIMTVQACSPKFSALLTESLSENFALAANGAKSSHSRVVDGDYETWGVANPPDREFELKFPEMKKINRVIIYSRNITAYQVFGWDHKDKDWRRIGALGSATGRQKVYADRHKLNIPRFDHRINFTTDRIRIVVTRAESDGVYITRDPKESDKLLDRKIEYIGQGRNRVPINIYQVYRTGPAAIREIEVYSHLEESKK